MQSSLTLIITSPRKTQSLLQNAKLTRLRGDSGTRRDGNRSSDAPLSKSLLSLTTLLGVSARGLARESVALSSVECLLVG